MSYILLHGLGQTSSSWNETIQILNEDWNIFCPDLSDWIMGKQPCYDTLYKAFEKYCEQFDDTLCLVGLSLGGILAMQYSMEHSEKVKSLVLIGTQYKMPRRLLKLQNVLFHLMPDSEFSKMGFQKSDFISLCKSMMDLDFSHHLEDIRCKVLVVCGVFSAWALLVCLLLPVSIKDLKNLNTQTDSEFIRKLAKKTGKFHFLFGFLLVIGIWIGTLLN